MTRNTVIRTMSDRGAPAHEIDSTRGSLVVRRTVARFLCRLPNLRIEQNDLGATLHRASSAVAWLVGHQNFYLLRAEERLMIKQLQQRLMGWLRGARSECQGERILRVLSAFIDLLRPMAHHRALADHDRRVIEVSIDCLGEGDPDGTVSRSIASDLDALFGLDEKLDRLLRESASKSLVFARLTQLYVQLAPRDLLQKPAGETPGVLEASSGGFAQPTGWEYRRPRPSHLRLVTTEP